MPLKSKGLNHNEMVVLEVLLKYRNIGVYSIENYTAKQGYSFPEKMVGKILESLIAKGMVYVSDVEVNKLNGSEIIRYSPIPEHSDYLAALIEANPTYSDAVFAEAAVKFVNRISDKKVLQTMKDMIERSLKDS